MRPLKEMHQMNNLISFKSVMVVIRCFRALACFFLKEVNEMKKLHQHTSLLNSDGNKMSVLKSAKVKEKVPK